MLEAESCALEAESCALESGSCALESGSCALAGIVVAGGRIASSLVVRWSGIAGVLCDMAIRLMERPMRYV